MQQRPLFCFLRTWRRRRGLIDPHQLGTLLAFILLICCFVLFNRRVRPVLSTIATANVSNAVTTSVNDAIRSCLADQQISYRDMVQMEVAGDGRISALSSNLAQANLLRAQLMSLVLDSVSDLSTQDFSVPMGNLTKIDLFSGLGPGIHARVLSTGAVTADFSHEFIDAGVNQTLHRIMLDLVITVHILLPGETIELPVSTQVCIAETVIVGQVPNTYLEWEH